ncbi:hypothetical protein LU646_11180 [Pseudomonas alloputida]|uniref:GapS6a family protein n=1 Tax=Pseudomonas alloputida TaxID=1940621 RepID=UPI001E588C29|nr:hypothetical protein [Pseudomonas alloputida]MCE1058441.1 hypothetical protein [Pseudomonas alloputida]
MDFITSAIISSAAYDIVKHGFSITAARIKEELGSWITQDTVADQIAEQLSKLEITDEHSHIAIERKIDKVPEIRQLMEKINADISTVAPSTVTTVNQNHSGTGDNVAGNKISHVGS